MEHISANGEITIIEVVVTRPALGTELLATDNQGVEHAETKEEGLKFGQLVRLCFLELRLIELGEGTTKVGLEILGGLVGNLNGVLHDGLGHDFH